MSTTPDPQHPSTTTTAPEIGKDVFEDMQVVITALRRAGVPGAEEAFERLVRRSLRAALNGVGRTAEGIRQAVPRFENMYWSGREEEHGK